MEEKKKAFGGTDRFAEKEGFKPGASLVLSEF